MNHELVCEGFGPTDAIKDHISELSTKLRETCSKDIYPHFFLSRSGPNTYTAGIKARLYSKDLYAEASDRDLYDAATQAKKALKKQILELNEKKHMHHHHS